MDPRQQILEKNAERKLHILKGFSEVQNALQKAKTTEEKSNTKEAEESVDETETVD